MKHPALFSLKDKSKKLKCRLLQFLFGASRVKLDFSWSCQKVHVSPISTRSCTSNNRAIKLEIELELFWLLNQTS